MDGINNSITNEDVVINYSPSSDVLDYSYIIYKDGKQLEKSEINNKDTIIKSTLEGRYRLEITENNIDGSKNTKVYNYTIDKTAPVIKLKSKTYKITTKETFDIKDKYSASDNVDANITDKINTNFDTINFNKTGVKKIELSVSDSAGNITEEKIFVTVVKDNTYLVRLGQFSIVFVTLFLICFIYSYLKSLRREKRFSKYSINLKDDEATSLFDSLGIQYKYFIEKYSKYLSKSDFISRKALKYKKYTEAFTEDDSDGLKFFMRKIVVGFIYITIMIIFNLLEGKLLKPLGMILPFIVGFYTLDLLYLYRYYKYRRKIENDMFNAVTIMNNAFKSGKNIYQAIDLAKEELTGPIALEFKKISTEISFGLDIEVAFKRFSERVNLSEAVYLTSSLSVLSKTGGNIIKVFDSIEKNMFNRKKLETEYKSLTASSRMITQILIFIPIVFAIFIYFINPTYFKPLIENPFGIILIVIMLLIYILYIIVVKKVMKIRGIK